MTVDMQLHEETCCHRRHSHAAATYAKLTGGALFYLAEVVQELLSVVAGFLPLSLFTLEGLQLMVAIAHLC